MNRTDRIKAFYQWLAKQSMAPDFRNPISIDFYAPSKTNPECFEGMLWWPEEMGMMSNFSVDEAGNVEVIEQEL